MYLVRITGVDDLRFETVNYDDAERVAALIVEYGIVTKTHYKKDKDGNILKDAKGYGIRFDTDEHAEAATQYVPDATAPVIYADGGEVVL